MALGDKIKELRKDRGLTQKALSVQTGIPLRTIINYENSMREPNARNLTILERFFNVSGEYLRGEVDRTTFLANSAEAHDGEDRLITLFSRFSAEYRISNQDEQRLALSVLEASLDLLTRFVLHTGDPLELTADEIVCPLTAAFWLNADGRAELVKRATELTELPRYNK